MSSQLSAAVLKGTSSCPQRKIPKPGSIRRKIYDDLMSGAPMRWRREYGAYDSFRSSMELLSVTYGLEIEHAAYSGEYRLLGEWDGPYFVPIERMVRLDA